MAEFIRVRGLVQGVGFRPTVWRLAHELGIHGDVCNDGEGVLIRIWSPSDRIARLCAELLAQCPPLARIDAIERQSLHDEPGPPGFHIVHSEHSAAHTGVVPDAATCPACKAEILDPGNRRHRYAFTNCTHCGPRLSIVHAIPYDRANTSMAPFRMCPECQAEYVNPADRRFHAQPNACAVCGPKLWLQGDDIPAGDPITVANAMLRAGRILALKGIGGFHLCCDAVNPDAVDELRRRKRRYHKPFALMARDLEQIRHYCVVDDDEAALLRLPAAPIVLLRRRSDALALATGIAPDQDQLGFMLAYSPLHILLLDAWDSPLVMTSGNLSDEPQCIDNADAGTRLAGLADAALLHDRAIVNRVDDSVIRCMAGAPRLLRRARGYAPTPLRLHPGFADAPATVALGGELKNTFCLLRDGQAIPSQHLGGLEDARVSDDFEHILGLYLDIHQLQPQVIAVDRHPDYRCSRFGRDWARRDDLELIEIQHHHAHIASVLAENGLPPDTPPVLGIALDGLGFGDDGTLWGGEFLRADFHTYTRLARLAPSPMPGATQAILEPWRNTWAELETHLGWDTVASTWGGLELIADLNRRPLAMLRMMQARGLNSPLTSSAGRLFDAVAGALGIHRDRVSHEGQAAIDLEAVAARIAWPAAGYAFATRQAAGLVELDPTPMWRALLDDLAAGTAVELIATRFHRGLADAIVALAGQLMNREGLATVALSGGVFQNRLLLEAVYSGLERTGATVLHHAQVPSNDGGLSLGQAAMAAAHCLGDQVPGPHL